MPYTVEGPLQQQPINIVDTVQNAPLGRKVSGTDPLYGYGEFVYAKATATIALGQMALIDTYAGTGTALVNGGRGEVGVAMAAMANGQFGWFQVFGNAVASSTAAAANAPAYASATGGVVLNTVSATNKIDGAVFKTANGVPGAGFAVLQLSYPTLNGNG